MSWIRSAVSKAVEVGGNSNLSRVVRSYADTVVNQAVVGGNKLFLDRVGARNFQNFKLAAKRLEEVSVSCRGVERVQLLRRWLVSLTQIETLNEAVNDEHLFNSLQQTVVMYYDPDISGEPMNFRDVFLHSQALEGITLSLILQEPSEEELSLLHGIFRLCLMGGKEALDVTVSSVQDLAKAFSTYKEEILAKREELLRYAQDAIAGLKVNAEIVRIDSEVSTIQRKLDELKNQLPVSEEISSDKSYGMSMENLNEVGEHFRLYSRLAELLLRKKIIAKNGYSPAAHNQKVDQLKVLSESLASSASKAEKRISDNRIQKEEALKFRVAKSSEVSILEKELGDEIKVLEKRKEELEEELKKVMTALISAHSRLHNAREERDQFEEASNQIVQHFNMKDDELSRSIALHRSEAKVCNTFINFLQSTWAFQSSCAEQKEKIVDDELERHEEYFVNWAVNILDALKEELERSISSFRKLAEKLKRLDWITTTDEQNYEFKLRKTLLEQHQTMETKITDTFNLVESIKKQFYSQQYEDSRKSDEKVKELIEGLGNIKHEFESIERPRFESPKQGVETSVESTSEMEAQRGRSLAFPPIIPLPLVRNRSMKVMGTRDGEHLESFGVSSSNAEAQLFKLRLELEIEDYTRGNSIDMDMEGNIEWEFDDKIEQKPRKSI